MAMNGQVLKDGEPNIIIMVDFISRIDNILRCSIVSQRGIINCLFVVCLKYSNTLHVMVVSNIFFYVYASLAIGFIDLYSRILRYIFIFINCSSGRI